MKEGTPFFENREQKTTIYALRSKSICRERSYAIIQLNDRTVKIMLLEFHLVIDVHFIQQKYQMGKMAKCQSKLLRSY